MSAITKRPKALMGKATKAEKLLPANSDALRDFRGERRPVFPDDFRDVLPRGWYPENSAQAEEMKEAGLPYVDGRFIFAISGESSDIRYGFDHPDQPEELDVAEGPIRILRLKGEGHKVTAQVLGFVGLSNSQEPVFFEPNPSDKQIAGEVVDNPAQQSELTQIVAAANDAIEWEFH